MLAREGFVFPKNPFSKEEKKETNKKKNKRTLTRRRGEMESSNEEEGAIQSKKQKREGTEIPSEESHDLFDALPDDLVVFILSKLSSGAESRSDLANVLMTSKRLKELGVHPMVLSKASPKCYMVKAKSWCESAHRFIKLCADAGNIEACYTLGMIRFYCLHNRPSGTLLIAKAAICSYSPALYSLAVIQFNGSGGSTKDKDLQAGVALCARAAFFGHVDALRELGHCLQDGYGVPQNIAEGHRFLVHANARELASVFPKFSPPPSSSSSDPPYELHRYISEQVSSPLLSDFGCVVPDRETHPASRFLGEWFEGRWGPRGEHKDGMRLCSQTQCGRPETRPHEFRKCSVCATVSYCSRACQALDWKLRHKTECLPVNHREEHGEEDYESDEEQRFHEGSVGLDQW
eukprot:TRINITY_DN8852_c1_g1_i1.p1 TRINITY_DN8852_c1_g1~~TRINITY_DN8852_c1_g1_i1.p1  ORF type:complete len:405 (+),score=36.77 TRINITY_DN8852_c1_g1_i1:106-1320(+)